MRTARVLNSQSVHLTLKPIGGAENVRDTGHAGIALVTAHERLYADAAVVVVAQQLVHHL